MMAVGRSTKDDVVIFVQEVQDVIDDVSVIPPISDR